jgi:hypothetical protein
MTNDENRMTKETGSPKPEKRVRYRQIRISNFELLSDFVIRHS